MTDKIQLRLHQIDLLRGLIIIFMTLDHAMVYCRDYFVTDPMQVPGTDTHVFVSRLLAHFCAPLLSDMTYGSTLIGLPEGFGLSYLQTLALTAITISLTWWLARFYSGWKRNNKTNLIAKYI